ncbi:MAG: response regulator transcription factor [Candidatus Bipolaricaulota bacterium]|nr:response regulator transcription factor [Candidatus Bipolaricaulota bacterium]
MKKVILVVDDEQEIVASVSDYLREAGYRPISAFNGESALSKFRVEKPDLVILDLGLPDINGIDVAREIRRRSQVPIVMLTARTQEIDRILGFELGADDYITKPFSPRELVLRVRALLRRISGPAVEAPIQIKELVVDLSGREVQRDGAPIDLTATEFDLLAFLVRRPNRVFTRMQLLKEVQGYSTPTLIRNIDNHIMNLRRKIENDPTSPQIIKTIYGVGYKLVLPEGDKHVD